MTGEATTEAADSRVQAEAGEVPGGDVANIHVRMAAILEDLPAVGKTSQNEDDGYSFRSIDAALNALNPILAKHGVYYLPHVLKRVYEQRATERGAVWYVVHLKVRFRFYGPLGDHVDAVVWGEGMDLSDKATSKSHTAAQKVALVQAFSISTREVADHDADKRTPEETRGQPRPHGEPEAKPWWENLGWDSKEEIDATYLPLLETCKHMSSDAQAALRAWRTENAIDFPPRKERFAELAAKVLELSSPPASPSETDVPKDDPAPAEAATGEPAEAPAEAPAAADQGADPTPDPIPDPDAPVDRVDRVAKAQADLAAIQERAQTAAAGPRPESPPAAEPERPTKRRKEGPKPAAPEQEPVAAAAETSRQADTQPPAPAQAEQQGKATDPPAALQPPAERPADKAAGDTDEADPMACTARYDGCAGQIESPQQKDMSKYRWQKAMCKSCTKKTAQAVKAGRDKPEEPAS